MLRSALRCSRLVVTAAAMLALAACTTTPAQPPVPVPSPTVTDPAVADNTACLDYYAVSDRWIEHGDLSLFSSELRAVVPAADEFLAGQLTNLADALDGVESEVPQGQAEAIAQSQIQRVCADAGVPAPVATAYF